jgi:predicted permease
MIVEKYRHPILFYGLSTAFSWAFWFVAAYVIHLTPAKSVYVTVASILGFIGLISPMIVAFYIVISRQRPAQTFLQLQHGKAGVSIANRFPDAGKYTFGAGHLFALEKSIR